MFFSCWENCFHITEAAADKYRKLVIGTGITVKVRNRCMWCSTKEIKTHQQLADALIGQNNDQIWEETNNPAWLLASRPENRDLHTKLYVKPMFKYTPDPIVVLFYAKIINIPNGDPACLSNIAMHFYVWHRVTGAWALHVLKWRTRIRTSYSLFVPKLRGMSAAGSP